LKKDGYRPPVAETQTEGTKTNDDNKATMPSIEELDVLLDESENILKIASMSDKEIDAMIEQRQKSLDRLQKINQIEESFLQRVERFKPLEGLTPNDYERLVQEKIIDSPYAERLKKLDNLIAGLESLDYPSADARTEPERLSRFRNDL